MRTLYIAAAISVLTALLMAGCGGPSYTYQPEVVATQYDLAPPVTLSSTGEELGNGQTILALQSLRLHVAFGHGYRGSGVGIRLILKDEQGMVHNLDGNWAQEGERISADLSGDGVFPSGSVVGVFSERYRFDGVISVRSANGVEYSTPLVADRG